MAQAVYWTLNSLLGIAILSSIFLWGRILVSRWSDPLGLLGSLVPMQRRLRPFWTPADFLVMFGLLAVLPRLLLGAFVTEGWIVLPQEGAELSAEVQLQSFLATLAATAIGGIASLTLTFAWLRLCNANCWREMQLSISRGDVNLGLRGALMILPPVLLISAAASYYVPYSHPVLESLANLPTPLLFVAMFATTALLTPVAEEFTFRLLLQGGLQGMADREVGDDGLWQPKSFWPIVVSSIIFALLHYGQGAAPIPLFFLALALGYLYRQTGRIAAPILVHVILNALTLCVEFSRLNMPT